MKREHGQLLFSATDLANHLHCPHLTELERQVCEGQLKLEYRSDPTLELLRELGEAHEQAYLAALQAAGKTVVTIAPFQGRQSTDATRDAMRAGADVIAQATLERHGWHGRADVLLKVPRPSELGPWSYEALDAKLAQTTRAGTVLQLCLYTELLAELQGLLPEWMHVVKPGPEFVVESFRVTDYLAYYRLAKRRFETHLASAPRSESYPEPNSHCEICNWWPRCHQTWRNDDHLTFVAGMSRLQRVELARQGISTLEQFASAAQPLPTAPLRGSRAAYRTVHQQARIQLAGRREGKLLHEFVLPVEEGRGFCRLPAPDPGDIFFDIEGNPRAIGGGIEYLLGYAVRDGEKLAYSARWALSASEERDAFERFIDFAMRQWRRHRKFHIYHFAPYEPAALRRLAMRHATREEELDQLLRSERFVDLYAVARQGLRASVESYSIKQLEGFYGFTRAAVLDDAKQSLACVERLLQLNLAMQITPEHRQVVEKYNRDDCLSTAALRDWLELLRSQLVAQGNAVPRPVAPPSKSGKASDNVQQQAEETQEVFEALMAGIAELPTTDDEQARWRLGHMLDYFRREDKCTWWEYFRLHELDDEELRQERKAVVGLVFEGKLPRRGRERTDTHRYRFEPQEVQLGEGDELIEVGGERIGTLAALDLMASTLDIKKRGDSKDVHPRAVFAFRRVSPDPLPESLRDFGRQVADGQVRSARYDLLAKRALRLRTRSLQTATSSPDDAIQLAFDLDEGVLPIQGPPGAGKTHVGSRMIVALARAGKRVGVTAVSHKVILNLLGCVHEAAGCGPAVPVGHRASETRELPEYVRDLADAGAVVDALAEGCVVGGTAWLWANAAVAGELDYLFIDEAGQMSLAMALAAGRAAKNLVLLGDPQQLEQPQQGSHPEDADVAALAHLLDGASTLPPDIRVLNVAGNVRPKSRTALAAGIDQFAIDYLTRVFELLGHTRAAGK